MIEVQNISKVYSISDKREAVVLNDISFTLPSFGFYFITGKSGCGKSTLLNMIGGFIKPTKGEILFNGNDISKLREKELNLYIKEDIGVIFQRYNLLEDLSVRENIEVAMSIKNYGDTDRLDALLIKYGLKDKEGQCVKTLSGGEKQRVALIRAIINEPRIILCDEPTGALDSNNGFQLMKELKEISKNSLVICVTHNLSYVELFADGYLKLSNGKICETKLPTSIESEPFIPQKKSKRSHKNFTTIIARKNSKKNAKLNSINLFSSSFSIFVLLLSLFFRSGVLSSREDLINTYVDNKTFSITKEYQQEIKDSNISLVRSERPKSSDYSGLFDNNKVYVANSYDYVFSKEKKIVHNKNTFLNFEIKPYLDVSKEENEVIINKPFIESYLKETNETILGEEIILKAKSNYAYYYKEGNENIYVDLSVEIPFVVGEIGNEFQYLNTPCLYYPSLYVEEFLSKRNIKEISIKTGKDFSIKDLIDEASVDDGVTSYKIYAFALDEESKSDINKLSSKTNLLKISNGGAFLVNSFVDIISSLFLGLTIFMVITIVISLFIAGFLSYTSAIKNRRESAILSSIGAEKNEIVLIFLKEELTWSFLGLLLGVVLLYVAVHGLNYVLSGFFANGEIIKIGLLIIALVFATLCALYYLICLIPLLILKKRNLYEELKEE